MQRKSRKTAAEVRQSLCSQQRQLKDLAEKLKQEITPQVREELEKTRQKVQQQMERLRRQMQGDWLEIYRRRGTSQR